MYLILRHQVVLGNISIISRYCDINQHDNHKENVAHDIIESRIMVIYPATSIDLMVQC